MSVHRLVERIALAFIVGVLIALAYLFGLEISDFAPCLTSSLLC